MIKSDLSNITVYCSPLEGKKDEITKEEKKIDR
jgi:hypothetical protein